MSAFFQKSPCLDTLFGLFDDAQQVVHARALRKQFTGFG
jgi:hypothetical protein